jgi:hypothetical protein
MKNKDKVKLRKKLMTEIHQEEYMPCECCQRVTNTYAVHHRKTKGAGGEESLDNYAILCCTCHELIHGYPDAFIKKFGEEKHKYFKGRE